MLPAIKVYDIDYDFIIKNYTDPKLWNKEWTLFVFKNYVFTLTLDTINVKNKQINFDLKLSSNLDIYFRNKNTIVKYNIANMNIDLLKKEINSCMVRLIESLEQEYIERKDSDYEYILQSKDEEQQRLREIAEDFLNDNGVYNDDIREVYIDYYVDNNDTIYRKLDDILNMKKYNYLTDLYLIISEITRNDLLKQTILNNQNNDVTEIISEVEEFMDYLDTDDYLESMQEKLESI